MIISETSKRDLLKFYPHIQKENYPINIIYNSIPAVIPSVENTSRGINSLGLQSKKYIMTLTSNNDPYKNQALIKSFLDKYSNTLKAKLQTTIIFVMITKGIPNGKILNNGVLLLADIPDSLLQELYRHALCFINPSIYEGFGLPVFEAMAAGTPVIALDIPIYQELCQGAITYCENNADDLWDKITQVIKGNDKIFRRVNTGLAILGKYTTKHQITEYREYFNALPNISNGQINTYECINLIIQSYNETQPERRKEIEYCILANLANPYVRWLHDFGKNSKDYLPAEITSHHKYIAVLPEESNNGKWLLYETAFKYSNLESNRAKYGLYWGIINADIFLDENSNWSLCRGWLNNRYILAQARHEFLAGDGNIATMDANFSKMLHANTQDGWFYMSPVDIKECNFEIGMLGCDNAIADRLYRVGYNIVNMPLRFKIMHYDIAKGKNSENFLEKHAVEQKSKSGKPKNSHPERKGQYLVPNYDALLGANDDIDLISIINQLGGISNIEKYKVICDLFSSKIVIYNP
jgi:hypothetical protein